MALDRLNEKDIGQGLHPHREEEDGSGFEGIEVFRWNADDVDSFADWAAFWAGGNLLFFEEDGRDFVLRELGPRDPGYIENPLWVARLPVRADSDDKRDLDRLGSFLRALGGPTRGPATVEVLPPMSAGAGDHIPADSPTRTTPVRLIVGADPARLHLASHLDRRDGKTRTLELRILDLGDVGEKGKDTDLAAALAAAEAEHRLQTGGPPATIGTLAFALQCLVEATDKLEKANPNPEARKFLDEIVGFLVHRDFHAWHEFTRDIQNEKGKVQPILVVADLWHKWFGKRNRREHAVHTAHTAERKARERAEKEKAEEAAGE